MSLFATIKSLIRFAKVTLSYPDDKPYPMSQATFNTKTANVQSIYPYGLYAKEPLDALALMFAVNGNENTLAGIFFDPDGRFMNLLPGEVVVGNQITKSCVKFAQDGSIVITGAQNLKINIAGSAQVISTGNIDITAPQVTINGNVQINGNLNASGEVNLGSGGPAIARVGDMVNLTTGQIITGGNNTST